MSVNLTPLLFWVCWLYWKCAPPHGIELVNAAYHPARTFCPHNLPGAGADVLYRGLGVKAQRLHHGDCSRQLCGEMAQPALRG